MNLPHPSPRELGFRMPPERATHAATWSAWPFDDALWEGDLEEVRAEFAPFVAAVAKYEPVVLLVRDDEVEADARAHLREAGVAPERVGLVRAPLDDVWLRDSGPLFVRRDGDGAVAATDWRFNGWGGKYAWRQDTHAPQAIADALGAHRFPFPQVLEGGALEVSGDGVALTTRSCLLAPTRNPDLDEAGYETLLREALGIERVLWLERGLADDHTDGHVDLVARFSDDETIVCAVADRDDDANHDALATNRAVLRAARRPDGRPFRVVELPLPAARPIAAGRRLPLSYANFYVGNGFVLVPTFDDPRDAHALEILRPLFPGRRVLGLRASALTAGGGAFHCVTQQQPAGEVQREPS